MSHCCDDHAPGSSAKDGNEIGIARAGEFDAPAFEQAIRDLLKASGIAPDNFHTRRTPERVRELWQRRLLGGYAINPADALGEGFGYDPYFLLPQFGKTGAELSAEAKNGISHRGIALRALVERLKATGA